MKSIAEQIVRDGGEIVGDDVVRIEVSEGSAKSVKLQSGRIIDLDRLVICAGAYSHLLAKQLGEKVLLEAERGYHMVLPNSGINSIAIAYLCKNARRGNAHGHGVAARRNRRICGPRCGAKLGDGPMSCGKYSRYCFLTSMHRMQQQPAGWVAVPARRIHCRSSALQNSFKCLVRFWPRPYGADLGAIHRPPDQRADDRREEQYRSCAFPR